MAGDENLWHRVRVLKGIMSLYVEADMRESEEKEKESVSGVYGSREGV